MQRVYDIGAVQHQHFIDLTVQAPVGGDIDKHPFMRGKRVIKRRLAEGLPVKRPFAAAVRCRCQKRV